MKLIRCHIDNFGILSGFDYTFSDGLNVILEENGFGKTTFAVFLKAMLYGYPRTAGRSIASNERKKYFPWQGGSYGGWMEFEWQDICYRVTRTFGKTAAKDTFSLRDMTNRCMSTAFSEKPGEELFSLDADSFMRSIYLPQAAEKDSIATTSIQMKLTNLVDNTDDLNNYDSAVERLKSARTVYQKYRGAGGRIDTLRGDLENLERMLDLAERKREPLQWTLRELEQLKREEEEIKTRQKQLQELQIQQSRLEGKREGKQEARQEETQLSHEERGELFELEAFFADKNIDAEVIEQCRKNQKEVNTLRTEAAMAKQIFSQTFQEWTQLSDQFAAGLPDPQDISEKQNEWKCAEKMKQSQKLSDWTERDREEKGSGRQTSSMTGEKNNSARQGKFGLMIFAIVLFSAGALCCAVGWLLPGVLLLGAGAGCMAASRWLHSRQRSENDAAYTMKKNSAHTDADVSGNASVYDGFSDSLAVSHEFYASEHAAVSDPEKRRHVLEQDVLEYLQKYNVVYADPQEALSRLKYDAERYHKLCDRKEEFDRKEVQREGQIRQLTEEVSVLFDQFFPGLEYWEGFTELLKEKLVRRDQLRRKKAEKDGDFTVRHNDTGDISSRTAMEWKQEEETLSQKLEQISESIQSRQQERLNLTQAVEEIPQLEDAYRRLSEQKKKAQGSLEILDKTLAYLEKAKERLSGNYIETVEENFRMYAKELLTPETAEILIDHDLKIHVAEKGDLREIASFSAGTADCIRLCMRFALIKTLFEAEQPFVILDDPFVNLDDVHLVRALKILNKISEKYQVIYLVCSSSRAK